MIRLALLLSILFLGTVSNLLAEMPTPEPADSLFKDRPFGPRPPEEPPTTKKINPDDDKPIPLSWIIGGASAVVLATALLLWGSARQWHSSNLFDRQYRFPADSKPALRLGAKKCGGHLARIHFGEIRAAAPPSKAKDT